MKRALGIAAWLLLTAASAGVHAQDAQDEPAGETGADPGTEAARDSASTSAAPTDDAELPEEHRPALTLKIDTGEDGVRTGDLVRVVITAEVPEGDDVAVPEQQLGSLEIFDRRHTSEVRDGRRRFRFELDLLALEPGQQELPAIRLRVVTADGVVGSVQTEARTIEVGSHVANEPDAQPKPPTRPVPVLEEDYTLLWVLIAIGVLLLVALISFLFARWWSRRPATAKPAPPPRPPWEVALEKLDAIKREKSSLIAEGKQVELVDRVSDALREYLGARYDFNGLESTTDEVVTRLAKVKLRGIKLENITALLADSDLVKFAKAVPDEAQCDRMLEGAVRIVRATTPRPEATPVTQAPSGGTGARIVTRDGEVTLPISAQTLEEAEREIRAAVGGAFRELAREPSFEGTLRVVLSASLEPSATTTDALRRLHARLSSELGTLSLPDGRKARVVLEHLHERPHAAAEQGRSAARTIIDDEGVRVEGSADPEPSPEPHTVPHPERPEHPEPKPEPEPRPAPAPEPEPEPKARRVHTGPATWASAPREVAPSEPPEPRGRTKTGPVDWDRAALRESAPVLERLLPSFTGQAHGPGVLVRWVTGIERPITYLADGEPLTTARMSELGLTRGGVHERALANLRRALPPGFAPSDDPAVLDDEGAALLSLPELVPQGAAWIAYPLPGEGLVVMREGAASTAAELERIERAHRALEAPTFTRPVRVTQRGFTPLDWPSRATGDAPGGER